MTDAEVGRKLYQMAKRWPSVNHQENELLREAARRLMRPGTTYPGVRMIYDGEGGERDAEAAHGGELR